MKIWIEKIHLSLTVNWKLSRNQTTFKENFIVHLDIGKDHFRSEIAPNIRYRETPESIEEEFSRWIKDTDLSLIESEESLLISLSSVQFHSLRFGLESVFLSYFAKRENQSLASFLGLKPQRDVATSFTMPILPVGEIADYLKKVSRFKSLKIKVNAETAQEMLFEISKYTQVKLRIDGNEAWRDYDQYRKFEESLQAMNVELIEQPFPSSFQDEYIRLKKETPFKILADESIEDVGDFLQLKKQFHAINIKLMKTGSLLVARDLIQKARAHELEVMMGCMIETTIGISYGMLFSGMVDYVDLDGFLLLKNDPFQLVKESEGILSLI